ncbi:unnamed protein product [Angiostrongylus costaricensis]|uniref:BTB_2 domain-containing protein n=1 Tax=Angiostrongylus costaricensis TaxID=334426 RepID=A0A158PES8_ANGCS|nr:unnamed protein product [Angiostrongylus costaricensis]
MLKLNIGGMPFRIRMASLFSRTEEEKLVMFALMDHEMRIRSCDAFIIQDAGEYYFERSSMLFDSVFKYYVTGQLHRPLDVCYQEFSNELGYWKIPESLLSTCCLRGPNKLFKCTKNYELSLSPRHEVAVFCLVHFSIQPPVDNPKIIWESHPIFGYIETFCIIWFTFEFVLRLAVTPSRQKFLAGAMNIVDMTAIVPFYLELGLAIFGIDVTSLNDIKGWYFTLMP